MLPVGTLKTNNEDNQTKTENYLKNEKDQAKKAGYPSGSCF